jgi:hypothetical protein
MVAMLELTRHAMTRGPLPVLTRLLAAPLLAVIAVPASAQQGVITSFDVNVFAAAINAVGGKPGQATVENGKSYYTLTLPSGIPAVAYFDDCEGQVCKSLVLLTSLSPPPQRTVGEIDEMLRTVNNNVPSAKVFRVNDKVVLLHYVLADFGIAAQNLQEHLKVFSNTTASMYQTLNPQAAQQQPKPAG